MRSRSALVVWSAMLCAMLAACGGSDTTAPPTATDMTVAPATSTLDAIGATAQLTAAVKDQYGQAMPAQPVTWASANTGVASVSSAGLATAVANGTADITAKAGTVTAHVKITVAQAATTLRAATGDQQTGVAGQSLAAPLVAQVSDRLGHPVGGARVTFTPMVGTVTPTVDTSDASGHVSTAWTLGTTPGAQQLRATLAGHDSVIFTATAQDSINTLTITSITPDSVVDGQSFTIMGSGFDVTPANNIVTVDGAPATVTAASVTHLTVTPPAMGCAPARSVIITVQARGKSVSSAPVGMRPKAFTSLYVGQEIILQDPAQFCLQFPAGANNAEYMLGLSAPAELPGTTMPFVLTTTGGGTLSADRQVTASLASATQRPWNEMRQPVKAVRSLGASVSPATVARWRNRASAELRLRQQETRYASALAARRARGAIRPLAMSTISASTSAPALGDTLTLNVPDINSTNSCQSYTTIHAVVRVIGTAGIWVEDLGNPVTADSLTLTDIQAASDKFDQKIYAMDVAYFGEPSDLDNNGHVIVVLTKEVNKGQNILGFVFSGDLFPPGDPSCPESNGGELYYGEVPDPLNIVGTGARAHDDVVTNMPTLIAHEFTHIIQNSQRLVLHNGTPMALWEMEGQATFAQELVGDAVLGLASGQNYDRYTAFGPDGRYDWYADEFTKLIAYYGGFGTGGQTPGAPEQCTVYGNLQLATPCDPAAFYGASWILQRYIGDQYGFDYPGGLQQLTRDWIAKNLTVSGTANIQALLGVNYDSLFARFATALAVDDRANSSGSGWNRAQYQITSWNSADIAAYVQSCCSVGWLAPTPITYGTTTTQSRSVRGGSTAYAMVSGTGSSNPAMAVSITIPAGGALATTLRPILWIVRMQ